MPTSVTLSSSGISRAVNLDWASGKFTSWSVSGSSSGPDEVTRSAAAGHFAGRVMSSQMAEGL